MWLLSVSEFTYLLYKYIQDSNFKDFKHLPGVDISIF